MRGMTQRFCGILLAATLLLAASSIGAKSAGISDKQVFAEQREYMLPATTDERIPADEVVLEAIDRAKHTIEKLLEHNEQDRGELADALSSLARLQGQAGLYDAAVANYLRSIEMFTAAGDHLSATLVNPLRGLARVYSDMDRLDSAVDAYERALHIDQVNYGLYRLDQSELLLEMSELQFRHGDYDAARALQEHNVAIATRNARGDVAATLPALYYRADMLSRTGDYLTSQKRYRRIIGLVEDEYGTDSPVLLPALHRIADVFLYNEIRDGYHGPRQSRRYLRRAIRIAETSQEATTLQKADAHLAMGDYLTLKTLDYAATVRSYRQAWDLLSADESLRPERAARFSSPVALNDVPSNTSWPIAAMRNSTQSRPDLNGVVVVGFEVNEHGRVVNARVLESDPGGVHDAVVLAHLDGLVFRPRFVDRDPVPSPRNRFEIRFVYEEDGGLPPGSGNAPVSVRLDRGSRVGPIEH